MFTEGIADTINNKVSIVDIIKEGRHELSIRALGGLRNELDNSHSNIGEYLSGDTHHRYLLRIPNFGRRSLKQTIKFCKDKFNVDICKEYNG
jgi:hypothetical protein|tara:strand:+ start:75 stop:350 length:276 start_codon:yes stop_codon:yes gene_type:complete